VITIVAILISLLLPALRTARDQARATQCASMNRQMGLAVMTYANDWDMYIPLAADLSATNYFQTTHWAIKLMPYLQTSAQVSQIYTRTPRGEWWFCDVDLEPGSWNYPNYGINLTMAGHINSSGNWSNWVPSIPDRGTVPRRMTILTQTTRTMLITELKSTSVGFEYIARTDPGSNHLLVRYRHAGAANVLFFDGHVERMGRPEPGEYLNIANEPGSNGTVRKLWK